MKRVEEMQIGLDLADIGRNNEAIEHQKTVLDQDPDDAVAAQTHAPHQIVFAGGVVDHGVRHPGLPHSRGPRNHVLF